MEPLDERYDLASQIGAGGSADVFLAVQRSVGREVAIKVLRPDAIQNDYARRGYVREGAVLASLKHPNIVTVHDVGLTEEGLPYFVMEYVCGNSLATHLQGGRRLAAAEALPLFEQVAAGLAHAHRKGILHRDVKPGNVLLEAGSAGQAYAKLTDFGVATHEADDEEAKGILVGTPYYLAPERFQGHAGTKESDLYGVGVLMFRTLTGDVPFAGETWADVGQLHAHEPVPRFSDLGIDDVSPKLEGIVRRCLEKNPGARYWSAEELREDLEAARQSLSDPVSFAGAPARALQRPTSALRSTGQHFSWSGGAAGLVVVLLLGVPVVAMVALHRESLRASAAAEEAAASVEEEDLEGAPFPIAPLSAWTRGQDEVDVEGEATPSPSPRRPRASGADDAAPLPPEPSEEVVPDAVPEPPQPLEDGSAWLGQWEGRAINRRLTLALSTTDDSVDGLWRNEPVTGRWWWEGGAVQIEVATPSGSHRLVGQVSNDEGSGDVLVRGKPKGSWYVGR